MVNVDDPMGQSEQLFVLVVQALQTYSHLSCFIHRRNGLPCILNISTDCPKNTVKGDSRDPQ